MKRLRAILLSASFLAAAPAFAASSLTFQGWVDGYVVKFVDTAVIPLLYILAFLFFLFGMVKYFFMGGAENREVGRTYALWAIIGMVVIFSVWGLVKLGLTLIPVA